MVVFHNKKYNTEKKLQNAHTSYDDIMPAGWINYYKIRGKLLTISVEIPQRTKVLDIGCNSGEIGLMLQQLNDCTVYGIDISETLVEKATRKGVIAVVGRAQDIPFKKDTFDCVFLGEMIEHTHYPDIVLKEIRRVLRDNGLLVGTTVDEEYMIKEKFVMDSHLYKERHWKWDDERLHARSYNPSSLAKLLSKYFRDVKTYSYCFGLMWIFFKGRK